MSVTVRDRRKVRNNKCTLSRLIGPSLRFPLTLLSNERQTPGKDVHEIWQPVRMRSTVELSDVHHIVLILEHRRLVVVDVKVVRS